MDHPPPTAPASAVTSASSIASALAGILASIDAAIAAAGRPPGSVELLAVSKTHPAPDVQAALDAGQCGFGENRVQEAQAKFPALRLTHPQLRLHLIGPLQTNKAEAAVALFDTIQTLDRPRLADAIERAADRLGRRPSLLVQVNIADEPQKAGVACAEADAFIAACHRRFDGALTGLMAIPPAGADPQPYFLALAALARRHALPGLSMGMSGDYEAAIAAGATIVRVGSAIFGARPALA